MERLEEIIIVKKIKRLYFDCGWKNESAYRCAICNFYESTDCCNNNYELARPKIVDHITQTHKEYCYTCTKCDQLFIAKKDVILHTKTEHPRIKHSKINALLHHDIASVHDLF